MPLTALVTSPRLPPGLLTAEAWDLLRAGPVYAAGDHRQTPALLAAGVEVRVVPLGGAVAEGVWLSRDAQDIPPGADVVVGSTDPAGARLLDAVAVMHRLRAPGGCPWDAEQTHRSLMPYLLEEAYEAYEALEDGDGDALREELGDLLLQVLFHAELAAETGAWDVDAVAEGLVRKLVERHPHVFAGAEVSGADEVNQRWEELKAAQKGRTSVTDGVPLSMAALALAAKLQRRAARAGAAAEGFDPGTGLGAELWRLVTSGTGDAEVELRTVARRFRDELRATEEVLRRDGVDPRGLTAAGWRARWMATSGVQDRAAAVALPAPAGSLGGAQDSADV